jgi:hypothetical protein
MIASTANDDFALVDSASRVFIAAYKQQSL